MLKPFHLVAALPLLVSACGSCQGLDYAQGCPADAAERVQAADWARVRTITVRVRRDEFVPMIISFTQDRPYVLRLENVDRVSHVFRAPKFFEAIAMESATVGDRELAETAPNALSWRPRRRLKSASSPSAMATTISWTPRFHTFRSRTPGFRSRTGARRSA